MFSAAVDLNNYVNLADRKCAVQDEIELNWFEEYTGPYCLLDCKAQSLLQLCSCVPYYYPGIASTARLRSDPLQLTKNLL